jgi:hypothetical protein
MIVVEKFEFIFYKKNLKILKPLIGIKHLLKMKLKNQKYVIRTDHDGEYNS